MSRYSSRAALRQFWQAAQSVQSGVSRQGLYWLLRSGLVAGRTEPGGFLLPTVTLLLLVLSLVVGTLVYRTFNRTAEVIGQRQQRALYNGATPAIDRAKAKLEYIFEEAGLPTPATDNDIYDELQKDAYDFSAPATAAADPGSTGAESRLDLNGDGVGDNAWFYRADVDGDGTEEQVVYSITSLANADVDGDDVIDYTITSVDEGDDRDEIDGKADAFVVRNGPINLRDGSGSECDNVSDTPYAAWETVNSGELRKAIQVHAVVLDENENNWVAATLEMQQDRVANLGNRWGAWFRYDLELNPSSLFNFSGAMHTEGNFIWSNTGTGAVLHLVSSPKSCVYTQSASEISMADIPSYTADLDPDADGFQGQVFIGRMTSDSEAEEIFVDRYRPAPGGPTITTVGAGTAASEDRVEIVATGSGNTAIKILDSVTSAQKDQPSEIALNPVVLQTLGISEARADDESNRANRASVWIEGETAAVGRNDGGRIFNESTPVPFLDDTYRADNRLGPAVGYGRQNASNSCRKEYCLGLDGSGNFELGQSTSSADFVRLDPMATVDALDEESFGYDGYWERRARRVGVRIIVGQRLELGNATEWSDNDPLYPPEDNAYAGTNMADRAHEMRQWRTLRDNLAAAQATAVYHYKANNMTGYSYDYPVACLATTAHPGTRVTDEKSRTFVYAELNGDTTGDILLTDFYTGQGTNGIEFSPPFSTAANPESAFAAAVNNPNSALSIALTNLAYFAGDPYGTFPATQDSDDANNANDAVSTTGPVVHPYPVTTMWGNFSELRRVITDLEGGKTYANLSPADKSTLHTATCTVGMLAYATDVKTQIFENNASLNPVSSNLVMSEYNSLLQLLDNSANTVAKLTGGKYGLSAKGNGELWQLASPLDAATGLDTTTPTLTCASDDSAGVVMAAQAGGSVTASSYRYAKSVIYPDGTVVDLSSTYPNAPWTHVPVDASGNVLLKDVTAKDPSNWNFTQTKAFLSNNFGIAQWMCAITRTGGSVSTQAKAQDMMREIIKLSRATLNEENFQVYRDRAYGFRDGKVDVNSIAFTTGKIPYVNGQVCYDGLSSPEQGSNVCSVGGATGSMILPSSCNPTTLKALLEVSGKSGGLNNASITAAVSFCDEAIVNQYKVQYPALFYLFPFVTHTHDGTYKSGWTDAQILASLGDPEYFPVNGEALQQSTSTPDPDVKDNQYTVANYLYADDGKGGYTGTNAYKDSAPGSSRFYYRPVEDGVGISGADQDGIVDISTETMAKFVTYLGVIPRNQIATTISGVWATPVVADTDLTLDASRANAIFFDNNKTIASGATQGVADIYVYPAFLDVGMYNGRELMSVRSLNIDLDLLRRYRFETTTGLATSGCVYADPTGNTEKAADNNGECWLPLPTLLENNGGTTSSGAIIYTFREDAVREDAIARPTRSDASNLTCDADTTVGSGDDDEWRAEWLLYVNATDSSQADGNTAWGQVYESNTASNLDPSDLLMNAVANTGANGQDPGGQYYDPPINPCTGISPKPVDFYADPDRRPHGFTLRNGSDLRRMDGSTPEKDGRGMTFISDNPLYVQGNFNLHSTDGTTANVEEFEGADTLVANWSNFYSRSDLNEDFADAIGSSGDASVVDTWRPTELIADGVTVLSADFTPGYIAQGLLWSSDASTPKNSYGGMMIMRTNRRPNTGQANAEQADAGALGRTRWLLENGSTIAQNLDSTTYPSDISVITSPLKIDRNGFPLYYSGGTTGNYYTDGTLTIYGDSSGRTTEQFEAILFDGSGDGANNVGSYLVDTSDTNGGTGNEAQTRVGRVQATSGTTILNALLVGGTNPTRSRHSSGGLAGMLRLIQNWPNSSTLQFSGSIVQLNFNAYSGIFHQGAWEPGTMAWASTGQGGFSFFSYFKDPGRNWAYDPALLYAPASPAARRFAVPGSTRSEFYRELAANDPYIMNLRCARYDDDGDGVVDANDPRIDPRLDPATECLP